MASYKRLVKVKARADKWERKAKDYKQQRDEYKRFYVQYEGYYQETKKELHLLKGENESLRMLLARREK